MLSKRKMGLTTRTADVLADERGRKLVENLAGIGVAQRLRMEAVQDLPIGQLLHFALPDGTDLSGFWRELARVPLPDRDESDRLYPDPQYENSEVPIASAQLFVAAEAERYQPVEVRMEGPSHGNPFVDVDLQLTLVNPAGDRVTVGGFYDGDGTYFARFLPDTVGRWTWSTASSARSLHGHSGAIQVRDSCHRGPVRVADQYHFAYADGTAYTPFGTTAYAWTHQDDALERATLATLGRSPFNKVRMCVFPKHYELTHSDPPRMPFAINEDGTFDTTRFNPDFFRHFERRVEDLNELGIQADVILFHPYDRWGLSELDPAADERYLQYLVRRLAAHPNVWWSMANEWDFITGKAPEDWERLAAVVRSNDHVHHLLSIHNGLHYFDYARDWVTHVSVQKVDPYRTTEETTAMRIRWGKPIVYDEFGYEGDVAYEWGNLTAVEMVRRFWEALTRGGYATHGETYWNEREQLWWAAGGALIGDSVARIAFLRRIVEESPSGRLEPTAPIRRAPAGVAGACEITYIGNRQPRDHVVHLAPGRVANIDVIDTWNMTVDTLHGPQEGRVIVPLPTRPWMAVRVRYESEE